MFFERDLNLNKTGFGVVNRAILGLPLPTVALTGCGLTAVKQFDLLYGGQITIPDIKIEYFN